MHSRDAEDISLTSRGWHEVAAHIAPTDFVTIACVRRLNLSNTNSEINARTYCVNAIPRSILTM